jgi:hypothetical protein
MAAHLHGQDANRSSASAQLAERLNVYHWQVLIAAQHGLAVARGSHAAGSLAPAARACFMCARDELASLPIPLIRRSLLLDHHDVVSDLGIEVLAEFQISQPEWFSRLNDAVARIRRSAVR